MIDPWWPWFFGVGGILIFGCMGAVVGYEGGEASGICEGYGLATNRVCTNTGHERGDLCICGGTEVVLINSRDGWVKPVPEAP